MPKPGGRGKLAAVALAVLAISALHYATPPPVVPWHTLFLRLYYLPILLAALEFGWRGGLGTALFSGVICYAPHLAAWRDFPGYTEYSQYGEIIVFALVGTITGILSSRGKERTQELQERAQQLSQAHRELQDNFEQLKRADRLAATGRLAAGLALEMQRPLAAIERAIGELEDSPEAESVPARVTDRIRQECRKWDRLLSQVLDFSRPGETRLRAVAVSEIIDSVAMLLAPVAQRKAIPLLKTMDRELPPIECQPEHITQALLSVAMSATDTPGRYAAITLAACRKRSGVSFEVRAEYKRRVSSHETATGEANTDDPLGLFVADQIMREHSGTLEMDANARNGRTISLYVPYQRASQPPFPRPA